jgi:hypothetical protein
VAALILVFAVFGLGLDFLFHTLRFSDGPLAGFQSFSVAVAQALRAYFAGADLSPQPRM